MTYTKIQCSLLLFVFSLELVWIKFSSFSVYYDKEKYIISFLFTLFFFLLYIFYKKFRPDPRIVSLLETLFIAISYSQLILIFSYLVATIQQPLVDSTLASIDSYFGIYVPSIDFWFRRHESWGRIFTHIYNSFLYQFPFVLLYFSYYNEALKLQRFLMQYIIAVFISIVISGIFPALGPYGWYNYTPNIPNSNAIHQLLELRQNILDLNKHAGIVTLPSFHAVMALIYIYVFRSERKSIFIIILVLNILMIFSCMPMGQHYFADLLAAVPVFLVTIAIEALLYKWVTRSSLKNTRAAEDLNPLTT